MLQELLFSCEIQKENSKKQRHLELRSSQIILRKYHNQSDKFQKVFDINNTETRIEWIFNEQKLSGFMIFNVSRTLKKQKQNVYVSDEEALIKLKNCLDGKAIYQNIQNHYELFTEMDDRKKTKIFKCQDKFSKQLKVAKKIKIIESNSMAQLDEEIKILMKINLKPHKYLLKVNEIFIENGYLIYIMKKCNGGTLYQYICSKNFTLDFDTATKITKKILKGVQHLNSLRIIHRDLKLDNIMFEEENKLNTLKIIDFELSVINSSRNSQICGTPGYIAPEVLNGEQYSFKSDIYSVGCVFHALLTGRKIFPLDSNKQNLLALNKSNRYKLSSKLIHTQAYEILLLMLKNVSDRPTAAECLSFELFQDKFLQNDRISHQIKKLEFPQLKNPFQTSLTQLQ